MDSTGRTTIVEDRTEGDLAVRIGGGAFSDFAHTGPGTLGGRLMRTFWQPVGLSDELVSGRALPVKVLGEEFTLYRGESGEPHLVDGRCAHRGTLLSLGFVEGECLRCFYHGWQYDSNGQCVDQAIERPSFAARVKIESYPVYEYLGLIFAYLGEGEPPVPPRYPEFESGCVVDAGTAVQPYNYFQNVENSVDTLHAMYVHRMSNIFADGRPEDFKGDIAGHTGMIVDCEGEETDYGFVFRDIFDHGVVKVSHFEMPTVIHIKVYPLDAESGWRDMVGWKVPIDDGQYRSFNLYVAHVDGDAAERYRQHPRRPQKRPDALHEIHSLGDEILAGRLRLTVEDVGELARSVNLQDYLAQRGQGVIADREHEQLGRSDRLVILLRSIWSREMRKIDEGEAPKTWSWPGHLETTTGNAD